MDIPVDFAFFTCIDTSFDSQKKTAFEEETKDLHGIDFLINVSNDINTKTEKENSFYEKVFSPKKIIVTNVLIIINILVYIISTISVQQTAQEQLQEASSGQAAAQPTQGLGIHP